MSLNEEDVRQALIEKAKKFWSKKSIETLAIEKVEHDVCYHYVLESFNESREAKEGSEPLSKDAQSRHDQNMSVAASIGLKPGYQVEPNPWNLAVFPDEDFVDHKKVCEFPGSSQVVQCGNCKGNGKVRCSRCSGSGWVSCTWCRGKGARERAGRMDRCSPCNGKGSQSCNTCRQTGKVTCNRCKGHCYLRFFTKLKAKYTLQRSDHYTECEMLGNKITKVTGTVKFSDCQPKLESIEECPSEELKQTSVELLKQHSEQLSLETQSSRHVKQRHYIELIPIANGTFRIGQKSKEFVVYGNECNCHVPKKPSRCSIL
ncbi:protein SSUH2 like protein [Ditylenchus destructor]|nr:protein SSUH2 like protein [Ditylenchus destructor]